ncbi:lysoplasmalogenase [Microbacterium sp. ZW T5_56]|uniref:lysoplasmalogenase n=1 Tax=Microbacterium sp. ZW T5_56 TaxID=3378081 RepID=UPI003851E48D
MDSRSPDAEQTDKQQDQHRAENDSAHKGTETAVNQDQPDAEDREAPADDASDVAESRPQDGSPIETTSAATVTPAKSSRRARSRTAARRVPRWAFLPFIALSTVHVIALAFHNDALATPTKLGLMPLLAFAVLVGARGLRATAPIALLLAAILFSWLGDGAGVFVPFLPTLPMMLAFFGIAHLAYIALFWRHLRVRKFSLAAALLIVWWAAMVIVIAPAAKELAVAVAAYGIVLGLTAAFATRCSPMVLVGALFFLASDTILAFMLFLPELTPPITDAAIMFTYTLGQGLIAAGALAALRRRQNAAAA